VKLRCISTRIITVRGLLHSTGSLRTSREFPRQDRAPQYFQSDIQYGAQIFTSQCTSCHGENGDLIPA